MTARRKACASRILIRLPRIFCCRHGGFRRRISLNRYTGTFKLIVLDTFVVVGMGKGDSPVAQPALGRGDTAKSAYVFHCDKTWRVGSFTLRQSSPVQTEGLNTTVYTLPVQASTANSYATSLSHIVSYFWNIRRTGS